VNKVEAGERHLDAEELRQVCEALDVDLISVVEEWLASVGSESPPSPGGRIAPWVP
jgi:hypothetical protein